MPPFRVPLIASTKQWLLADPRRALVVSGAVLVAGLILSWFGWAWYRSFPAQPPHLPLQEAVLRIDAGHAPWIITDPIAVDCAAEFSDNDRLFAPATVAGNTGVVVVVDHPQVVRCQELDGRPVVGVLDRAAPRRLTRWAERGLRPANPSSQVDVLVLETDAGPAEARLVLFVAAGMILFGAALYPMVRRQQRIAKARPSEVG